MTLPVGETYKSYSPGALRASYGISYSDTDHYYIGTERDDATETNVAPATLGIEHLLGFEYDLARGFSLAAEVPFVHTEQSREFGGVAGSMKADGLGDLRLLARYWWNRAEEGTRFYTSVGVRVPTGESGATFQARNGRMITQDLAAQAGTGNLAGIVELGASRPLGGRFAAALSARYIFTPEATTVNNFRNELTGNGRQNNSDADAATARLRLSSALGTGEGWLSRTAAHVTADLAWVPYDDLFGDTEGFRRAGPIVMVGPGASVTPHTALTLTAGVPITVYRDVQQNGGNVQEWMLQFAVSYDVLPGGSGQ